MTDTPGSARSSPGPAPRRGRQLVEILQLAADGDVERATGLAAEHVLEFPGDAEVLAALDGRPERAAGERQ